MTELSEAHIDSPIGTIVIVADADNVVALDFASCAARLDTYLERRYGAYERRREADPLGAATAVRDYLSGDMTALDNVPVDPAGTPFQQRVWRELRRIPSGTTIAYGQLAARLGNAAASRAVGLANSKNPIGIVIPCHRVIGADGSLTGYAGGVQRKHWLLTHEGATGQLGLGI